MSVAPWIDTPVDVEVEVESQPEVITEASTQKPEASSEDKEASSEEEKAPEAPPKKRGPPEAIPYARFKEVNEKYRETRERLEALEQAAAKAASESIPDPDDIDPLKYETKADYIKAVRASVEAKTREAVQRDMSESQVRQAEATYQNQVITKFTQSVDAASKENPAVAESVQWLGSIAKDIDPSIRLALMSDDNAADLCHALYSNDDLAEKVLSAANPIVAIRELARQSAKIDISKGNKEPQGTTKPEAPRVPRPSSVNRMDVTKIPTNDLVRMYRTGKLQKRPWE